METMLIAWLEEVSLNWLLPIWVFGAPIVRGIDDAVAYHEMTKKAEEEAVSEHWDEANSNAFISSAMASGATAGVVETWPRHSVESIELGNKLIKAIENTFRTQRPYKISGF